MARRPSARRASRPRLRFAPRRLSAHIGNPVGSRAVNAPSATPEAIGRDTWLALVAMSLGVFVIANDFTALSVAIPNIEADFNTSLSSAQWTINGYALVFGV